MSSHPGQDVAGEIANGPGQMLFRFVRHWSKRAIGGGPEMAERGRDVWVTEAVYALSALSEITVNDVAAEMGIDQSGASRMLAHATDQGYLKVGRSSLDARRRTISITAAGGKLLREAHAWQEDVFARLTEEWTHSERREFGRAMARLIEHSRAYEHRDSST